MAINSYAGLLEALQKWTPRSDTTFNNRVPDFVALAEDRILNGGGKPGDGLYTAPLRTKSIETTGTITLTAGIATLPATFLYARKVFRAGDTLGLDYVSPERFAVLDAAQTGGLPGYYTVEDAVLKVTPTYTGDLQLTYYASPVPLTVESATNTLIVAHPMVYLSACLFEAFSWMQEPDLAMGHLARLKSQIDGLNKTNTMAQFMGGTVRVTPRRPLP